MEKHYNGNSIEEVLELLDLYRKDCKLIAGGTDIVIALKNKKISPKVLIDISKIKELKVIEEKDNKIFIGAGASYTDIIESNIFGENMRGLILACREVGSPQIRNKGTIGGNIANNSPAADSIPPLIALGGKLRIASIRCIREILLEDYCSNNHEYGLKDDELIIGIEFHKLKDKEDLNFNKLGLRKALAISRISISTFIDFDENYIIEKIRVASGSIGRFPMREKEVEDYLLGKKLNQETIDGAVKVLQLSMDERLKGRSTLPYKRRAVERVLRNSLISSTYNFEGNRETEACHPEGSHNTKACHPEGSHNTKACHPEGSRGISDSSEVQS